MREAERLVRARLHNAEGAPARAIELLQEALAAAEAAGVVSDAIQYLVVLAVAADQLANHAQAMAFLERALDLAEPGGYVRTFLDEGPAMIRLLHAVRPLRAYVTMLMHAAGEHVPITPTTFVKDPPSERELEVLRLIADGLDNAQIADQLVISVNTVKSHAHHLMNKLGANNRIQLVGRARELHLLP